MDLFGPIGRRGARLQSVLEAAVQSFDYAVRLRVVSGGLAMLNIEYSAMLKPHIGSELRTSVRSQSLRYPKAGYPMRNKDFGARRRGRLYKRNGFHPMGCAVNYCEQMGETVAIEQRANQVNMNMRKTSLRNWNF